MTAKKFQIVVWFFSLKVVGSFIFRGPAVAAFCPKKGAGAASLFSGKAGVTSDNLSVPTDFAAQSRLRPALCLACMENVVSELEPRVSVC